MFLKLIAKLLSHPGKDFNTTTLRAWGSLLRSPYQGSVVAPDVVSDSQRFIGDEEKVDDVALQWNVRVLKEPLRHGAAQLLKVDPNKVTVAKRTQVFRNPILKDKGSRSRKNDLKPDMTIHVNASSAYSSATMLVMGDNKFSGAWDFETSWKEIHKNSKLKLDEDMRPFRQLATYCWVGKTRYGYIMSDQELLAVRVWYSKDKAGKETWGMEVSHPIPWDASSRSLTVNLAIWWLGVMAMNERERPIKSKGQTPRINGWYENKGPDGKIESYTHILVGKTMPANEKPLNDPVYPRGR